jgi:hypothetical protein
MGMVGIKRKGIDLDKSTKPYKETAKWFEEAVVPPCGQGGRKIQLPYINKFETIWEYKEAFFSEGINFSDCIGPECPICGNRNCYEEIDPYWRYAIDLFPEIRKEPVPIARFLCQEQQRTFSLLPIQLIPYFQYTVAAVIGTLLLGVYHWQTGRVGFRGAEESSHPESNVTAWLVFYWLTVMVRGLRRGHAQLMLCYDLSRIETYPSVAPWQEFSDYLAVFGIDPEIVWRPRLHILLYRYSLKSRLFLFGTPSQYRSART